MKFTGPDMGLLEFFKMSWEHFYIINSQTRRDAINYLIKNFFNQKKTKKNYLNKNNQN